MDPSKDFGNGSSATNANDAANQQRLVQETFDRVLDVLKQLGLHRRSPKFFIVYAHENDNLDIKAHKTVVTDYISWFKEIQFNVDSDKSPHGYGPIHDVAHAGASVDIVKNQVCLLPRSWHKENVDYVLVFYSELLAHYMEVERDFMFQGQTYTDALFRVCDRFSHTPPLPWEEVCSAVANVQQTYLSKMNNEFHHVLTELALLKFRQSIAGPQYTIPVLLFDDKKQSRWKPDFSGMDETQIRLTLEPGKKHQLFFKILLMFETLENDRPLIEALQACYLKCVGLLSKRTLQPEKYRTQVEVEISQTLRNLNNSEQHWMIDRPITIGSIRDVLNLHSIINRISTKRVSGKKLPENLSDISLSVAENPNSEDQGERWSQTVSIHSLFDELELIGKKVLPRRVLIQGRPGVGKTTLSKRIMYEYCWDNKLRMKFDLVVRIPVRKLGQFADLADLLFDEYFQTAAGGHELSNRLRDLILGKANSNVLTILDGLDEARQWSPKKRSLLERLMSQPVVIMTSRSYETGSVSVDLTIEALGLDMEDVEEYLANAEIVQSNTGKQILNLIKSKYFIEEMVQVPIHLDILCYSWDELQRQKALFMAAQNAEELCAPTITALYQAVVHTLWRKDIPGLGKLDNGEQLTTEVINAVQDAARLERVVYVENSLLEEICINMIESDQFEFGDEDIVKAIRHIERNGTQLPLSLEFNLNKLSFLHSDCRSHLRRFSFIHLTFQEFFAAQWLTKGQQRLSRYIRQYKYSQRFERVWRFVPGLLQTKDNVDQLCFFFNAIQKEPRDILGPAHQRLVMNLLSEVTPSEERTRFSTLRTELEVQLSKWLAFECTLRSRSLLACEIECSGKVLCDALKQGPEDVQVRLLQSVARLSQIPSAVTALLTNWLGSKMSQDLKYEVIRTMIRHTQVLPLQNLEAVWKILDHEDEDERIKDVAAVLLSVQPALPLHILEKLLGMLKTEETSQLAVGAFSSRLVLPRDILAALVSMLKSRETRGAATAVLECQSITPPDILAALVAMLEKQETREAAVEAFPSQPVLPPDILATLVAMLKKKKTREAATVVINCQSTLPQGTQATLVTMLEKQETREAAIEVLKYKDLTPDIEAALVALFENKETRNAAARVLRRKEDPDSHTALSADTLEALVAMLERQETRVAAAAVLKCQSTLPPDIQAALVVMLEKPDTRGAAAAVLKHKVLTPDTQAALVAMLKDRETQEMASEVIDYSKNKPTDTLPLGTLKALVAMLEYEEIKAQAALILKRQLVLPKEILDAMTPMLEAEDRDIRTAAVTALNRQPVLPKDTLDAIVPMLGAEDRGIRNAAATALGRQSALPPYILRSLLALLKEKETQPTAANIFKNQLTLPEEILNAIKADILDIPSIPGRLESGAFRAIKGRSDLPLDILEILAEMLKVEDLFYENDAMAGLECQSALPKEILKIIAEMLEDENEPVRERVARLLKGRSILPFSELQYRIGHAKRDGFLLRWLVEAPLEGELALPRGISNRHMECLYSAWLSESFKGNMYWYVDGDVSYIERSGKRIEMRLDCRGTQFLDMIRKIQTNLRVPLDNPPNPANL